MSEHLQTDTLHPVNCRLLQEDDPPPATPAIARLQVWLWGGLALAVVILLGVLLGLLYQQARHQATADVGNLNRILEARLNSVLHDTRTNLQGVALRMDEDLLRNSTTPLVQPWQLRALVRRFPALGHFDVLAVDGSFLFDSDGLTHTPDDDQQRFRQRLARQHVGDAASLTVLGHDKAREQLYMAVPIVDGQQRHLGWVVGSQLLKPILASFSQVDVGPHGVITLRQLDHSEAILRVPAAVDPPRNPRTDGVDRQLDSGVQEGTVLTHSRVDDIKRLYGFKRVGDFPLVLVIGLAQQDYLLTWKYTVIAASLACGVLYLLIVGLTLRLQANRVRRQQVVEELRHSAYHDELTALPNRRYLLERVNRAIGECGRGQRLALLYIDVDHFKTLNDSLGHVAGDAILQRLAQRLLTLRPTVDTVARLSGDEFLLLVEQGDPARLATLVASMLQTLQQPLELAGYTLSISASAGIALYPADGHDFGSLLKAADSALAQAKRNGRQTWVFYEASMGARELRLLNIQTELRLAFVQRELSIHYQPQIDLSSGRVIGAEALLRWNHPGQGPISPAEFIPVAEASGLIMPISFWLLNQVCHQAVAWQAAGFGELTVAMNCSAVQFRQGSLVQDVRRALHDSGLKPHLLELELTESILIEHSERVLDTIDGLKALGVRMSIDDFGTGYSSMAYLKRFAVDKLKIDQSFVRGLLSSPHDAAIVQAVITLGHSFDMKVIAEGVEDADTLAALVQRGCDEVQGYHYAKPLSVIAFEGFMSTHIESFSGAGESA